MWVWIGVGAAAAVALFLAAMAGLSAFVFHKFFGRRYDGNPHVRYFSAEDFEGLEAQPVSFLSDGGQRLHGYIYSSRLAEKDCGVAVFSHGFGAGHRAYTTEIDALARAGFTVLAYDDTGCAESEGKCLRGFDQGPADLLSALRFAALDERLRGRPTVLFGHSWGAFSVLTALPRAEGVKGAAALCGFVSSAGVVSQTVFGRVWPCRAPFFAFFRLWEFLRFGRRAGRNAKRALEKVRCPVFLCYGARDAVVPFFGNGKKMLRAFTGQANVRTLLCENKGHNVYLTEDAERYMNETFASIGAQVKKDPSRAAELYGAVDYRRMTAEDGAVMGEVLSFLQNSAAL